MAVCQIPYSGRQSTSRPFITQRVFCTKLKLALNLAHLLPALRAHVPKSPVTVFLRSTTIDTYLTSTLGVTSIVHGNFADLDLVEEVAREHDIVINVASSWDVGLSAAIVRGMRKGTEGRNGNGNGKQKSLIHMSGTGNFVDKTWTDGTHRAETKVWNVSLPVPSSFWLAWVWNDTR